MILPLALAQFIASYAPSNCPKESHLPWPSP